MRSPLCVASSRSATSIVIAFGATAQAQTKWDLASAYPATNFHVENITQFAKDVVSAMLDEREDRDKKTGEIEKVDETNE